jgi:hypothetical protein
MSVLNRRNRKRRAQPRINLPVIPWLRITSVLGVLLLVGGAVFAGRWLLDRPVEHVVINGEFERVSADHLESLLRPYMGQGFLATPLDVVQQQLAEVPWIAAARVSRKWPGTLAVSCVGLDIGTSKVVAIVGTKQPHAAVEQVPNDGRSSSASIDLEVVAIGAQDRIPRAA